jgi:hypothetical protein
MRVALPGSGLRRPDSAFSISKLAYSGLREKIIAINAHRFVHLHISTIPHFHIFVRMNL